ncbi:hypothetical protein FKM82_006708 [Ascaphus truei]
MPGESAVNGLQSHRELFVNERNLVSLGKALVDKITSRAGIYGGHCGHEKTLPREGNQEQNPCERPYSDRG